MADDDPWKYERIAGDLRARIRSGEYAPGAKLPSKRELKLEHKVRSEGPVNQALRILQGEGLIETHQGQGAFVCNPLPEVALSEYETVMRRIDALTDEVRQLRGEVAAIRQAREA